MSDLRKAAEELIKEWDWECGEHQNKALTDLIEALRQALAQPEQEPFIYVREDNERPFGGYEHCSEVDAGAFPVYTAPPKREWVGLTDEDLSVFTTEFYNGAVWAEAKLKEKNT